MADEITADALRNSPGYVLDRDEVVEQLTALRDHDRTMTTKTTNKGDGTMTTTTTRATNKEPNVFEVRIAAQIEARRRETDTGKPWYVVALLPPDGYEITDQMPFVGTWWTSDDIRHG